MANPTLTQENEFAMLQNIMAGKTNAQAKSKTVDYKVLITNKNGEVRNVGYLNLWNRFSEAQIEAILAIVLETSKENKGRISVELATNETTAPDDEF